MGVSKWARAAARGCTAAHHVAWQQWSREATHVPFGRGALTRMPAGK